MLGPANGLDQDKITTGVEREETEVPMQMTQKEIRKLAQRRVAAWKGFFTNLVTYVVINAISVVIWFVGGGGYPWFLCVAGFWGVALIFHAFNVFVFPGEGGDWEQNEIGKEMVRIKRARGQ